MLDYDKDLKDEIWEKARAGNAGFAIAYALFEVARQIKELGMNDAATPLGAIEFHAEQIKKSAEGVEYAIQTGLKNLAEAIPNGRAQDKGNQASPVAPVPPRPD